MTEEDVPRTGDTHWLTRYDPNDGEPIGTICDCEIAEDHNGYGDVIAV